MFEKKNTNQRLTSWRGDMPVTNLYTAGIAGEEFFRALKDKGEIQGTRCNRCEVTYVPARMFCERCFAELREYLTVANQGELISFTVCHVDLDGRRLDAPIPVCAVKLQGADTVMIHRLDPKLRAPRIGMKVQAVLKPKGKRAGSILDIEHFAAL